MNRRRNRCEHRLLPHYLLNCFCQPTERTAMRLTIIAGECARTCPKWINPNMCVTYQMVDNRTMSDHLRRAMTIWCARAFPTANNSDAAPIWPLILVCASYGSTCRPDTIKLAPKICIWIEWETKKSYTYCRYVYRMKWLDRFGSFNFKKWRNRKKQQMCPRSLRLLMMMMSQW